MMVDDAAADQPFFEPEEPPATVLRLLGTATEHAKMWTGERKFIAGPWWWALEHHQVKSVQNVMRRLKKLGHSFLEPLNIVSGAARIVSASMKAKWAGKKDADWLAAADDLIAKNPTLPLLGAGSPSDKARTTQRLLKVALQSVVLNTNWMSAFDADKISAHIVRGVYALFARGVGAAGWGCTDPPPPPPPTII